MPKRAPLSEKQLALGKDSLRIFSENFVRLRTLQGMTQKTVVERSSFSQSWISAIENAKGPMTIYQASVLADIVGAQLYDMFRMAGTRETERSPPPASDLSQLRIVGAK